MSPWDTGANRCASPVRRAGREDQSPIGQGPCSSPRHLPGQQAAVGPCLGFPGDNTCMSSESYPKGCPGEARSMGWGHLLHLGLGCWGSQGKLGCPAPERPALHRSVPQIPPHASPLASTSICLSRTCCRSSSQNKNAQRLQRKQTMTLLLLRSLPGL